MSDKKESESFSVSIESNIFGQKKIERRDVESFLADIFSDYFWLDEDSCALDNAHGSDSVELTKARFSDPLFAEQFLKHYREVLDIPQNIYKIKINVEIEKIGSFQMTEKVSVDLNFEDDKPKLKRARKKSA